MSIILICVLWPWFPSHFRVLMMFLELLRAVRNTWAVSKPQRFSNLYPLVMVFLYNFCIFLGISTPWKRCPLIWKHLRLGGSRSVAHAVWWWHMHHYWVRGAQTFSFEQLQSLDMIIVGSMLNLGWKKENDGLNAMDWMEDLYSKPL